MYRRGASLAWLPVDFVLNAAATWRERERWPAAHLLRHAFDTCGTYDEAVALLIERAARQAGAVLDRGRRARPGLPDRAHRDRGLRRIAAAASIANDWHPASPPREAAGSPAAPWCAARWIPRTGARHSKRTNRCARFDWLNDPVLNAFTRLAVEASPATGELSVSSASSRRRSACARSSPPPRCLRPWSVAMDFDTWPPKRVTAPSRSRTIKTVETYTLDSTFVWRCGHNPSPSWHDGNPALFAGRSDGLVDRRKPWVIPDRLSAATGGTAGCFATDGAARFVTDGAVARKGSKLKPCSTCEGGLGVGWRKSGLPSEGRTHRKNRLQPFKQRAKDLCFHQTVAPRMLCQEPSAARRFHHCTFDALVVGVAWCAALLRVHCKLRSGSLL